MSQPTNDFDSTNDLMSDAASPSTGNFFRSFGYAAYYMPKKRKYNYKISNKSEIKEPTNLVRSTSSSNSPRSASTDAVPVDSAQSMAVMSQSQTQGESIANMAGLSALVYGNGDLTTHASLPGLHQIITVNNVQYEVIDAEDDSSGYQGMTLWDAASKSIIVVNRGTEPKLNDVWTDAKMAFSTTSNQWQGALALGNRVSALAAQFGATSIYCAGHSLGGTLTQMQAAYFGWTGYTFNAYGAGEIYGKLGLAVSPSAQVHNYRTLFDLVSDASTQIGYTPITVETPRDVALLQQFYSPTSFNMLDLFAAIGKDHSISNFIVNDVSSTAVYQSTNIPINLVPGFNASISPRTLSLAQDIVASLGELAQAALGEIPSGNLSLWQYAQEVMQFMDNEPASGIKAFIPSDPSLLSNALNSSAANNNYRASLSVLSPVLLQGDSSAFTSSSYNLWAPGQTSGLTADYLTARNAMIQAMIASAGQGQQIGGSINTSSENSYIYTDLSLSPSPMYTLNGKGGTTYDIVFGDNKGDVITASSAADVELFGGTGNDTLYGGSADSTLQGGAGNDEYVINGASTGTDHIVDTDGQGSITWKFADGSTEAVSGGSDEANTPYWKSSDGKFSYVENLSADGSTELEITSGTKIVYIDDFTNGEFGINLNTVSSESTGSSNLSQLNDEGLVGDTTPGGNAQHVYENNASGGAVETIYGADSSGNAFGNEIIGDGKANFISAGNGNNHVILGGFFNHATDPTIVALNAVIEGGSGNQVLIGVGNGAETITGGGLGADTAALTAIDGGGAQADLQGGGQNSVIFGGTGADTLEASTAINPSNSGFNPESDLFAGLSFWGDAYSTVDGSSGNYYLGSLPQVAWTLSSPDNLQVELSLFQSNDTYAAPFELLGSSFDSGSSGSSTLPGSLLIGGSGTDLLVGNSGNDTIMGGQPGSPVNGKTDEVLVGGAGADLIYGGSGSVVIYADMSPGAVSGWASLDPNDADTIYAGTGSDFIYGSGGKDVIYGGAGNDVIHAGNGATYIDSGSGNSSIYGGTGNDTIVAEGSSSYIQTGDGNTFVDLVTGTSSVTAGGGQDTIDSEGAKAVITGGSGSLTVIVQSDSGDETIQSGTGGTVLALTDGLTESSIVVRDVNGDLVITDPGFEAAITVSGYFGSSNGVSLQFADGTTWGVTQISQASMAASPYGGNDTLVGSNGNDSITAGAGDTSIVGISGNNTLTGGAGNDTIDGGSGADTIEGGSATTLIIGGTGTETYVYNLGDGADTILENTATKGGDTIAFGSGISASDINFIYDSSTNVLIATEKSTGNTVTVDNFVATGENKHQILSVTFADGTTLSQLQVVQKGTAFYGTTANDSLVGTSNTNYFDGLGGNDVEVGNGGNDSFVFNSGYGQLEVNENYTSGQTPVLLFGAGIAASSLHISGNGYNVVLTDGVVGDQITLDGMLSSNTDGVALVQFADGTILSASQILQDLQTGTTGSDTLYGTTGADLIDGKGGSDVEIGNGGDDTFVFNQGYGQLEINEAYSSAQQPVLELGAGIAASALNVSASGNNLLLTDGIGGDQVILDNANLSSGNGVAEVKLADGTTLRASQLIQLSREISGTSGNDTLEGTSGADLIDGKGGNDYAVGNGGDDTFVFNAGYGSLEIDEYGSQNSVLQMGAGITASALTVTRTPNGSALVLTDGISGDRVIIGGTSQDTTPSSNGPYGVQKVAFADGTTLALAQLILMASEINGTTGNDTIEGTAQADLIDGKGGNDSVDGNGGNDTFVFNAGYGNLVINEYGSQEAVLQLGPGITASDLKITPSADGTSLIMTDGISGDQITLYKAISGFSVYSGQSYGVQEVAFADGTAMTFAQLAYPTTGTTGNDTLEGTSDADLIDGKGGKDYAIGNGGNDTFVFNSGYGSLEIYEYNPGTQQAVLQLGPGITASSLNVTQNLGDGVVLTDGVSGDQIVLDQAAEGNGTIGVQKVTFADGTSITGAQLVQLSREINGTTGSDTLQASASEDQYGTYVFDGKGGNDVDISYGNFDTFVFDAGYGHLEINNDVTSFTPQAVLQLGAGITASALHVTTNGTDLILTDGISGDQVTLDGMWRTFAPSGGATAEFWGIGTVQLADGTTLTAAQLVQMEMTGTTGSDVLYGTAGADLIDGKGGNDAVVGNGGSDTFVFDAGYGDLTIDQYNARNTDFSILKLGAGITASALHVTTNGTKWFLTDGVSGDQIILYQQYSSDGFAVSEVQFADGSTLSAAQLMQMELTGTSGNDTIYGTTGADLIDGKGGSDTVIGNGGNDTFVFNSGYGNLAINETSTSGQQPVLQLGPGIVASALHVTSDGNNLYLTDGVTGDQITLDEEMASLNGRAGIGLDGVATVTLADGSTLTTAQLIQMENTGTTSNDTLYGTPGAELIDGRGGNDSVVGNGGNDTFVFNAGYGSLTINESYTSDQQPVLQLGAGITESALRVTGSGSNLVLTDGVSGDQIILDQMLSTSGDGVAMVQLADGTTLTASQLLQMEMIGTTGNDTLYGTPGADVIDGKGGSDSVVGNGGSDTFVFNAGYGDLEINEAHTSGQQPVLQLGTGITASALHVTESNNNLIVTDGISGDQIILDGMWSSSSDGVSAVDFADGTSITGAQLVQMEMTGTTGNDAITGTSGADLIDGKGGNDSVTGGGGSDTFVFNSGYGQLVINEVYKSGQVPVLKLGAGITSSALHVTKSGNDLVLTDGVSGDQITLINMSSSSTAGVASLQLADGTTLTRSQIIALEMIGTPGNDTITGTPGADYFDGRGGNDSIIGEGGSDTFVFNSGYGSLTINEAYKSGQTPILKLGAGITASALHATKSGSSLVLTDGVSGDQITLNGMFTVTTDGVASLQLSDGTTLSRAQMIALEMTGTTGNDTITGTSGDDLIDGKGGADSVTGGGGNDTFVFNSGYGKLTINEVYTSGQAPVLKLGAGITSSTLHVAQSSNNMVLTDGVSGDQITLIGMWTTSTDGVATVQFSDGTTLSRSQLLTKGAAVKSAQLSRSANITDAIDGIPQRSLSTASENASNTSTVATSPGAAVSTMTGDASHNQVNVMIHAMASFTGMSGSDAGQSGHPMSSATMPDLMLHSAA